MQPNSSMKPRSSIGAWLVEALVGLVVGVVAAPLFGYGSGIILTVLGVASQIGMGLLLVMLYAGIVGFAVGASVGVALAGRFLGDKGQILFALLASGLGAIAMVVLISLGMGSAGVLVLVFLAGVMLVLAVVGYHMGGSKHFDIQAGKEKIT